MYAYHYLTCCICICLSLLWVIRSYDTSEDFAVLAPNCWILVGFGVVVTLQVNEYDTFATYTHICACLYV